MAMAKPLSTEVENTTWVGFSWIFLLFGVLFYFKTQMLCRELDDFYHFIFFKIAELNLEALASHEELLAAGQELRNTAEIVYQPNTR